MPGRTEVLTGEQLQSRQARLTRRQSRLIVTSANGSDETDHVPQFAFLHAGALHAGALASAAWSSTLEYITVARLLAPLAWLFHPCRRFSKNEPSVMPRLPITVEQYHRLSDQAIVAERTELLQGVIIEQMTKSPRHTYIVQFLVNWLNSSVGRGVTSARKSP